MPAARSSSGGERQKSGPERRKSGGERRKSGAERRKGSVDTPSASQRDLRAITEQLVNRVLAPLDAVLITRERIQETLEEAAERGRLTRSDANDLVHELFKRGRQQTDDLLGDVERALGSATKRARQIEPVDRIVRGADRARRTVGVGPSFPIIGYDELTAGQVEQRLGGLTPAELRRVREYERRHANRKSVLEALERALA